jgi:hypothetical protein
MLVDQKTTMNSPTLCSYRTWTKRHHLVDRYSNGDFLWGKIDLSEVEQNICKYCGSFVKTAFAPSRFQGVKHFAFDCDVCGWWKLARIVEEADQWPEAMTAEQVFVAVGQVRRFQIADLNIPLSELRVFLDKHPDYVTNVNSTVFERLVQDCLRSKYPGAEVRHVGRSGDKGIDIKLITTEGDIYLVQVKRRTKLGTNEGVKAVRELNGVLFREGVAKGMVVTTAANFTKAAREEAIINTVTAQTYEMKLIPYNDFMAMLRLPGPYMGRPWEYLLDREIDDFGDNSEMLPVPPQPPKT